MFCPEGYVPFSTIVSRFRKGHLDQVFAIIRGEAALTRDANFFAYSPADVVEIRALESIRECARITSPGGEVHLFDLSLFISHDLLLWVPAADLYRALDDDDVVQAFGNEYFSKSLRLSEINYGEFQYFCDRYLEENPGASNWDYVKHTGEHILHHNVSFFTERIGYTISLQAFDCLDRLGFSECDNVRHLERILRPFEGWALCVPKEVVKSAAFERDADEAWVATNDLKMPQKPSTVADESRAVKRIVELFDENNQITKETAKAKIGVTLGTLAFGRAWVKARELRPMLGPGGRPKSKP